MTPSARLQAAIEVLDRIIVSARYNGPAADTIIAEWFRNRRYAGAKDRRAVRELVYRAIRTFGEPPEHGRAAFLGLAQGDEALSQLFDGSPYGPPQRVDREAAAASPAMPAWLGALLPADEHAALLTRAPLDLRANRLKTDRAAMLAHFPGSVAIDGLEDGLRIDPPVPVESDAAYRDGLIEVQDAGSQHVVALCAAEPGDTVIDLCAGGGGKTLALTAAIAGQGRLIATDTDRNRLSHLPPRAARADANVEVRLLDGGREAAMLADLIGVADVVLVDAPCTGSGTLRRNPEARWRITPDRLARAVAQQRHVLDLAVPLARPGGAIVYAVCSLIDAEGPQQVEAFLARHAGWSCITARTLTPSRDGTDGFFVARLVSPC